MKEKSYFVYAHENKINGKIYIGITSRKKPEMRWENGEGYKGSLFYRAIQKYGWNNFNHIILFSNLSKQEACDIERRLIKELKTQDRNFGYNVADGGFVPSEAHLAGLQKGIEQMKRPVIRLNDGKIFQSIAEAEAITGVPNPNIVKACKGVRKSAGKMISGTPMYWSYYSKDMNISKLLKEKIREKDNSRHYSTSQKVVCLNTNKIYLSLTDAQKDTGVFIENIIKCCKKKYSYAGKDSFGNPLVWRYYWDYILMSKEEVQKAVNIIPPYNKGRRLRCIEDGKIFFSQREAAKYYGIKHEISIYQQIHGRVKNVWIDNKTKAIHFEYLKEGE